MRPKNTGALVCVNPSCACSSVALRYITLRYNKGNRNRGNCSRLVFNVGITCMCVSEQLNCFNIDIDSDGFGAPFETRIDAFITAITTIIYWSVFPLSMVHFAFDFGWYLYENYLFFFFLTADFVDKTTRQ